MSSYRGEREPSGLSLTVIGTGAVVILLFILFMFFGSFVTVGVGEVGILKEWGAIAQPPQVFSPGIHAKMPFKDDVVTFDTRVQRADMEGLGAASRDGIDITTHLAVNYHIVAKDAPLILQEVGVEWESRVLSPAIQQSYKETTGSYVAIDLVQKRQEVADRAKAVLQGKVERYHIVIDDIAILNVEFPESFNEAIKATQVANQNRLKAQQDQERAKTEAETALIVAQGLANAQRAQATTLTPEYLELQAIQKWDGHLPMYLTPGSAIPFIGTTPSGGR